MEDVIELAEKRIRREDLNFYKKVYIWMFSGVLFSWMTSFFLLTQPLLQKILFGNWIMLFLTIILTIFIPLLSKAYYHEISLKLLLISFYSFSILAGVVFSYLCIIFSLEIIGNVFLIVALTFLIMSVYAHKTKTDITTWEKSFYFGIFGLIIIPLVNVYILKSSSLDTAVSLFGIFLFTFAIGYHTQKIKIYNKIGNEKTKEELKESLMGAFELYLDTIILFYYLIRALIRKR